MSRNTADTTESASLPRVRTQVTELETAIAAEINVHRMATLHNYPMHPEFFHPSSDRAPVQMGSRYDSGIHYVQGSHPFFSGPQYAVLPSRNSDTMHSGSGCSACSFQGVIEPSSLEPNYQLTAAVGASRLRRPQRAVQGPRTMAPPLALPNA